MASSALLKMIQRRDNSPRLVSPLPSLLDASIEDSSTLGLTVGVVSAGQKWSSGTLELTHNVSKSSWETGV